MKTCVALAIFLLAVARIASSQNSPLCPLWVAGGSLTIAATCTSVIAASLKQQNQACDDRLRSANEDCIERIRTLSSTPVPGEDCCGTLEAVRQERDGFKADIETEKETIKNLQRILCEVLYSVSSSDQQRMELCFKCVLNFDQASCLAEPGCIYQTTTKSCGLPTSDGK